MPLILTALTLFLFSGLVALHIKTRVFWEFVEIAYYPLVAIGVVLLFLLQEVDRAILAATEELTQLQADVLRIEEQRPEVGEGQVSELYLASSVGLLGSMVCLGNLCDDASSREGNCRVYSNIRDPLNKIYTQIIEASTSGKTTEDRLVIYCQGFVDLLSTFETDGSLLSTTVNAMRTRYLNVLEAKLGYYDFDSIWNSISDIYQDAETDREYFKAMGSDGARIIDL